MAKALRWAKGMGLQRVTVPRTRSHLAAPPRVGFRAREIPMCSERDGPRKEWEGEGEGAHLLRAP